MPAAYRASITSFLNDSEERILGALIRAGWRDISESQKSAWELQIGVLRRALHECRWASGHVLLEYPLARRGKVIDTVILTQGLVLVVEFKCWEREYHAAARAQVEDYCLDLRDFHAESRSRILVPVLVATHGKAAPPPAGFPVVRDSVAPVWLANSDTLPEVLAQCVTIYGDPAAAIDAQRWDEAPYRPVPTIVEAAKALYQGHAVEEIARSRAAEEDLAATKRVIAEILRTARAQGRKVICFVTGVPGAGKTLVGLDLVHQMTSPAGKRSLACFLSGNGPLVRVLREALARDHYERTRKSLSTSHREVKTFIQNVHHFIREHYPREDPPPDRVVVFDEAQRAWNREQSFRKFRRDCSEPEAVLRIMERHDGFAAIIALLGLGQEIHTGEAGLSEWSRSLKSRLDRWWVVASPEALGLDEHGSTEVLLPDGRHHPHVTAEPALHLRVSVRAHKAAVLPRFAEAVLAHQCHDAAAILAQCREFPVVMTRSLGRAKEWLREQQRGTRRIGLVASSGARRLRPCCVDVSVRPEVENWFLGPATDVRSSYSLELAATEFEIQGLELDWVGVCWDLDLVPAEGRWVTQAFKGAAWHRVQDPVRRAYIINKYRVLLTRAREGMVIWVPKGDPADPTRPPEVYDRIASYLERCGVSAID